jgi:hypothetical protein
MACNSWTEPVEDAANTCNAGSTTALHYSARAFRSKATGCSIILSEALLLAADTKITALIILQQIYPRT